MKKFKRVFYPIYVVAVIFVLLISFNIYDSLELFKKWGWFKYFSDLPFMVRDLMLFLSFLMIVELALENIHLIRTKSKLNKLEEEVTSLKAKLFDQSSEDEESVPDEIEESEE